jgi:hypothetical protein
VPSAACLLQQVSCHQFEFELSANTHTMQGYLLPMPMLCLLPQGNPAGLPAAHHAFINVQSSSCLLTTSCMHGRTPFCLLHQVIICQEVWVAPYTQPLPLPHSNPSQVHACSAVIDLLSQQLLEQGNTWLLQQVSNHRVFKGWAMPKPIQQPCY